MAEHDSRLVESPLQKTGTIKQWNVNVDEHNLKKYLANFIIQE